MCSIMHSIYVQLLIKYYLILVLLPLGFLINVWRAGSASEMNN